MLSRKKGTEGISAPVGDPSGFNQIANGTIITGEISTSGDIRIDGKLKGNITAQGRVVVGRTGEILGDIVCTNLDIEGNVVGNIRVAELMSLKETANIKGDIQTKKLYIEPGAIFTGTCDMSSSAASKVAAPQSRS